MKIAVTAQGNSLDDQVDPRFGRCPYFLMVDTESMETEAIQNPNLELGGGAGIQSAQLIAERGAEAVLTGNCGPNAYQTLSAAEIQVVVGVSGPIREAVERFRSGNLDSISGPNVAGHFGMGERTGERPHVDYGAGRKPSFTGPGGGRGRGLGMGGGRGRGMGGGMGMGRGMGRGMRGGGGRGTGPAAPGRGSGASSPASGAGGEIEALKEEERKMEERLKEIQERIGRIEGGTGSAQVVAVVDTASCTGCDLCADVCPEAAVTVNEVAHIDESKCTGCGICVEQCPTGALSIRPI